eukprot:sb/3470022/
MITDHASVGIWNFDSGLWNFNSGFTTSSETEFTQQCRRGNRFLPSSRLVLQSDPYLPGCSGEIKGFPGTLGYPVIVEIFFTPSTFGEQCPTSRHISERYNIYSWTPIYQDARGKGFCPVNRGSGKPGSDCTVFCERHFSTENPVSNVGIGHPEMGPRLLYTCPVIVLMVALDDDKIFVIQRDRQNRNSPIKDNDLTNHGCFEIQFILTCYYSPW